MVGEIQCQSNDCTSVIVSLSPCLNYIDGQSDTPTVPCCTQLASVVKSNPECLCEVLDGGGASVGININTTRALELPAACNVTTPPVSECNRTAGGPVTPPTGGGPSGAVYAAQMTVSFALCLLVAASILLPHNSYFEA
ncbi:non-specific lipid transfer protein GPI-anchored 19-like [Dioscorea cayenensis subsp. rotundata]|uniref:Non-specific lipid transfer protein GPI-anchored 19-like n=1 Tax=Dioscorea cayennensis subsp. rotundata TaxID=55577 RepID=A0AB40CM66_DIOCR|nr:non-specific lipid transfer protein GPI-anchored 19-like [Dioscorea cayenensis subsp. rotundata]